MEDQKRTWAKALRSCLIVVSGYRPIYSRLPQVEGPDFYTRLFILSVPRSYMMSERLPFTPSEILAEFPLFEPPLVLSFPVKIVSV